MEVTKVRGEALALRRKPSAPATPRTHGNRTEVLRNEDKLVCWRQRIQDWDLVKGLPRREPRAGESMGALVSSLMCARMRVTEAVSVMKIMEQTGFTLNPYLP